MARKTSQTFGEFDVLEITFTQTSDQTHTIFARALAWMRRLYRVTN